MTAPKPLTAWQQTLPEALPRHVKRNIEPGDGECWLWTRSRSRDGYGWASLDDKTHQAHRLVYRLVMGEPPLGSVLDHLCRVRHCVNPGHLEAVSPAENLRRSELTPAGQRRCRRCGGEFSQWYSQRRCIPCNDAYEARRRNHRARKAVTA